MDVAAAVPLPGRVALAAAAAVGLWWSGVGAGAEQCRCVCSGEQGLAVLELLGRQLERCGPEQLHGQVCPEAVGCAAGIFSVLPLGLSSVCAPPPLSSSYSGAIGGRSSPASLRPPCGRPAGGAA